MPSSNLAVAPAVLAYMWEIRPPDRPLKVLDVGPGWGKYAILTREYVDPYAELRAVEAWGPYVTGHRLRSLYDEVLEGNILDALEPGPVADLVDWADVVLIVDVLEHVAKAPALDVLARIPGYVVFSTPRDFFSNGPGLPPTEEHVSHWTVDDFAATGRLHGVDVSLLDIGGIIGRLNARD